MSVIRDMTPDDYEQLRAIHAQQGIDYAFPELESPLFFVKKVLEVDGKVAAALVLKLCAETMLLLGELGPREKMAAMQTLQAEVLVEAWVRGLDEIHASIPAIGFDRRLTELGWQRDKPAWNLWTKRTR